MRIDVMGVGFDSLTMDEAVARARDLMAERRAAYVVTPNPEIVMLCREDPAAMQAGGKKPGRGAYVCRQESCLMRAIRQKQLERQLEVQLTDDVAEALRQELAQMSQSQTEAEEN